MTTGNKIATVAFWIAAICAAVAFAWYNVRIDTARSNPWLFVMALIMCAAAGFGVRECIRAVKDQSVSPTGPASAAFWIGVAAFFCLAGVMTWAVLSK
ncbi:MAG: hypothetical protein ACXWF2_01365 [Usitatibacter sp.]